MMRRASSDGTCGSLTKLCAMPALLMAMSRPPKRFTASETSFSESVSCAMSPASTALSTGSDAAICLQRAGIDVGKHEPRAVGGQPIAQPPAETARRPGHQDRQSLKAHSC